MLESTDGGSSFTDITSNLGTLSNYMGNSPDAQGYYDTTLAIDPDNAKYVYAGGAMSSQGPTFSGGLVESFDGGKTWHDISPDGTGNGPHRDDHTITFDANHNLLDGDDGGIFRLNNPTSSANQTWSDLNTNLNITQFQGVAVDTTVNNVIYGGTQDNGTLKYTGSPGWSRVLTGDGGSTRVDPTNHNRIYGEQFNISLQISTDGGSTWNGIASGIVGNSGDFYAPYELDASGNLYYGTNYLNFSNNQGASASWTQIGTPNTNSFNPTGSPIDAIAVNPVANSNVVYVSAGGKMFVTQSAQSGSSAKWTEIDLPGSAQSGSQNLHNTIAVDPADSTGGTAFAVVNAFTGASSGHIFKTTNFGTKWTDISGTLPDTPVDSVAVSADGMTVFVGTDIGVYFTTNGGLSWSRYGRLPNAQVVELEIVSSQNLLVVATHGRGIWETNLPSSPATPSGPINPKVLTPMVNQPQTAVGNSAGMLSDGPPQRNGYNSNPSGVPVPGSALGINLTGTSVLANGFDANLAAPSLKSATSGVGAQTGPGSAGYVLAFFANPKGDTQGKDYVGSMSEDTHDTSASSNSEKS